MRPGPKPLAVDERRVLAVLLAADKPLDVRKVALKLANGKRHPRSPAPKGLLLALEALTKTGEAVAIPWSRGIGWIPAEYKSYYNEEKRL